MSQKQYCCFSEAMIDGAALGEQLFMMYQQGNNTCAVAAGLLAMFLNKQWNGIVSVYSDEMLQLFPYMKSQSKCPARARWWQIWKLPICICQGSMGTRSLVKQCEHLNDFHRWSREAIADWLFLEEEKLGFVTLTETRDELSVETVDAESQDVVSVLT